MGNELGGEDSTGIGAFILTELRDMRRGVESSIADLRQNIINLAQTINQTHFDLREVRRDLDDQAEELKAVKDDVEKLKTIHTIADNAWSGPKRAAVWISVIGGAVVGITAIWNFLPVIVNMIQSAP